MFPQLPSLPDFPEIERDVLAKWAEEKTFHASMALRADGPRFSFFEGPPTANGKPGIHHVWARVFKDLFCRFRTMQGYNVQRIAGWDTHGLPVEVEVEKQLGLADKQAIEEYGIDAFVVKCRESVEAYVGDWASLTERIGYWIDMDQAYWTLSRSYVESVWWNLKQLHDQGLLYEDLKVVPYCTRCGTALSSHELGQPGVYRDVTDESAFVELKLLDCDFAESLIVWTTTPWTLPANIGVAANPDLTYVVADNKIVAEAAYEQVLGAGATVTKRLPGEALAGLGYEPLYVLGDTDPESAAWRVVCDPFVTAEDGSGLVHLAPAFGEIDRVVARNSGLPIVNPVGADGRFVEGSDWLTGMATAEAGKAVLEDLAGRGLLVNQLAFEHSYPHCWRCSTPLIYWGKPSWYIATSSRKDDLVATNATVEWRPENVKYGRFGEWLENNIDWALSRDRYWGTPLPAWKCAEGHVQFVGSLAELSELAGRDCTDVDPHRPAIDAVSFACPTCGGEACRVEPVIDAWFDSGCMPSAQYGYPYEPGSQERFVLPADFVAEGIDQTRGWFYSLLAVNRLVFGTSPYNNVLGLGHLVDAEGRKMSKSKGNVIDPWEILNTRGADALRWWMFVQGSPWTSTRVALSSIDESLRESVVKLWSSLSFFTTYASLNGFDPATASAREPAQRSAVDRWLIARVDEVTVLVTEKLEHYYPYEAAVELRALIDDISNWYIRRTRKYFWSTGTPVDGQDCIDAHVTLFDALCRVALVMAPFTPFLAERMWDVLHGGDATASVHLQDWPSVDADRIDRALLDEMAQLRRLASLGHAARSDAGMRVRQPLRRAMLVLPTDAAILDADLLADELNVDRIERATDLEGIVDFEVVPNYKTLGPKLGPLVRDVPAAVDAAGVERVAGAVEADEVVRLELGGEARELAADDFIVRVKPRPGHAVAREGREAVVLDVELDEDLIARGTVREVIRQVQDLRRERGLAMTDRIALSLQGLDDLAVHRDTLGEAVLATEVHFGPVVDGTTLTLAGRQDAAAAFAVVRSS